MRNKLPVVFAGLIALLMTAGPWSYKIWSDGQHRNFRVVEEGVLYRSGQLSFHRLQQVLSTHGIRTIVTLRDVKDPPDPQDQQEEGWSKARSVKFVRIPPRIWWPDASGNTPGDASLKTFRDIMDDPANYPVLVHCFAGIHRTGMMCAVYRMDYQGWTNDEAIAEMRMMGYAILDDHEEVLRYLKKHRPPIEAKIVPAVPTARQIEVRP